MTGHISTVSVHLASENSLAESGIRDRVFINFSLGKFLFIFCIRSKYVHHLVLKIKERNLESVIDIFEFVHICVYV